MDSRSKYEELKEEGKIQEHMSYTLSSRLRKAQSLGALLTVVNASIDIAKNEGLANDTAIDKALKIWKL